MEFCLIEDDDGHWFVCPADKAEEAADALQAVVDYWRATVEDGDAPPPLPDYLVAVGGSPGLVRFTGWRIGR